MQRKIVVVGLLVSACGQPAPDNAANRSQTEPPPIERRDAPLNGAAALPPVEPITPGRPGGLPYDRAPIAEGAIEAGSAQDAANVVQTYFALIEAKNYAEAWRLWGNGGRASGTSAAAFAASFTRYREYHAQVGAPGRVDAGAGQRYVEVPVQAYGRLKDGREFHAYGPVTLHRVADIAGATAEQKSWRIKSIELKPVS